MKQRTRVVFQTPRVACEPAKDGPFAGCPQTICVTYVRYWDLDRFSYGLGESSKIIFYGLEFQVAGVGLSHKELTITATEEQIDAMLVNAKIQRHRWKKGTQLQTDGRAVFQQAMVRSKLH